MKIYTIYRATNNINGKVYIGFDSAWPRRMKAHLTSAKSNRKAQYKQHFHAALRKYGGENFTWDVLYQSLDGEHTLTVMEEHFIQEHRSCVSFRDCNGYNLTAGGEGQKLRLMSTETRAKKSKALYNRPSPLSRTIHTPHGIFIGGRIAARVLNIPLRTLLARLASPRFIDWYYNDAPKTATMPPRKTNPARRISTPSGTFDSISHASRALNLSKSTIEARIKSQHSPEWYRI